MMVDVLSGGIAAIEKMFVGFWLVEEIERLRGREMGSIVKIVELATRTSCSIYDQPVHRRL